MSKNISLIHNEILISLIKCTMLSNLKWQDSSSNFRKIKKKIIRDFYFTKVKWFQSIISLKRIQLFYFNVFQFFLFNVLKLYLVFSHISNSSLSFFQQFLVLLPLYFNCLLNFFKLSFFLECILFGNSCRLS